MTAKDELIGSLSEQEFHQAIAKTKVKEEARAVAYDVMVTGEDIGRAGEKHGYSYQRTKAICERVFAEVIPKGSVEFTVVLPAKIVPQVQQVLSTMQTLYQTGYETGKKDGEKNEDTGDI